MIVTEIEAFGKICHRQFEAQPNLMGNCIGSRCMAWRWISTVDPPKGLETPERKGFCGAVYSVRLP